MIRLLYSVLTIPARYRDPKATKHLSLFSGTKYLYLDDSITVSANPKDGYFLQNWNIKYDDNQPVEKSVLQVDTVNNSSIKLTLLTGASKKIKVSPVFYEKGTVMLNFYAKDGYVTPSVPKSYFEKEEFTVQYKSDGKHLFSNWKAVDKNGNKVDYVTFADEKAAETTCQVLAGGEEVTIIAESFEQPEITGFVPDFSTLVPYNSAIKVLFSLPMSNSCIYWTKDELQALGVTEENYDIFETEIRKFSEENPYYYAYQEKGKPETLTYKNIKILYHNEDTNLLSCYAEPFFETTKNKTLVIYAKDNPGNTGVTSVDVKLSSEFVSEENVPMNQSLVKTYQCNSEKTLPNVSNIEILSIEISGDSTDYGTLNIVRDAYGGPEFYWDSTDDDNIYRSPYASSNDDVYNKAPVISKDKVIIFKVKGKYDVTDSSTVPAQLICRTEQITWEDGKTQDDVVNVLEMIPAFNNDNYIDTDEYGYYGIPGEALYAQFKGGLALLEEDSRDGAGGEAERGEAGKACCQRSDKRKVAGFAEPQAVAGSVSEADDRLRRLRYGISQHERRWNAVACHAERCNSVLSQIFDKYIVARDYRT